MHEALVAFLYDEASPDEARRVEAHLETCGNCKDELIAFRKVRGMLQQWELDDMPIVRVNPTPSRTFLNALKELFTVTPVWVKAVGAVAAAMLVLAVMGTEVSAGKDGFSLKMNFLGLGRSTQQVPARPEAPVQLVPAKAELSKQQVEALINEAILNNEKQQKQQLEGQLSAIQAQLQHSRSADLEKLSFSLQQQKERIRALERDIDRREGLDLTDILFSSAANPPTTTESDGAEGGR